VKEYPNYAFILGISGGKFK